MKNYPTASTPSDIRTGRSSLEVVGGDLKPVTSYLLNVTLCKAQQEPPGIRKSSRCAPAPGACVWAEGRELIGDEEVARTENTVLWTVEQCPSGIEELSLETLGRFLRGGASVESEKGVSRWFRESCNAARGKSWNKSQVLGQVMIQGAMVDERVVGNESV